MQANALAAGQVDFGVPAGLVDVLDPEAGGGEYRKGVAKRLAHGLCLSMCTVVSKLSQIIGRAHDRLLDLVAVVQRQAEDIITGVAKIAVLEGLLGAIERCDQPAQLMFADER